VKLGYVTVFDPNNIKYHSGTPYYMAKALQAQSISLEYLGPLKENFSLLFKAKQYLHNHLFSKRYRRDREPLILKGYAYQVSKKLSGTDIDVVFSPSSLPIAYLECNKPIVFWRDATFSGLKDFYVDCSNLCEQTIRAGHAHEQAALNKCRLAIYSSEWAAKMAINDYQVDPSKVKVVPFGANIECNRTVDDIKKIVDARPIDKCKLLFLGVYWTRKGGDVALKVTKELNKLGLDTELTVIGCQPPIKETLPGFVKPLGFISKSTTQGREQLDRIIAESHFLILPVQAECYGVVFCEANSFGVPCLTSNVGGIPTIIKRDVNGKLFSKQANTDEYCQYICNLFDKYSEYKELALSSFNEYQTRLNWTVAGQSVKKLLTEVIGPKASYK